MTKALWKNLYLFIWESSHEYISIERTVHFLNFFLNALFSKHFDTICSALPSFPKVFSSFKEPMVENQFLGTQGASKIAKRFNIQNQIYDHTKVRDVVLNLTKKYTKKKRIIMMIISWLVKEARIRGLTDQNEDVGFYCLWQ